MTYLAVKNIYDLVALKDKLAIIIETFLKLDSSDNTLKVKANLKPLQKNVWVTPFTIKTSDYDIADKIKRINFIENINNEIKQSKNLAVQVVILTNITNTECEGCGK